MGYILTNAPAILAATLASLAVGALYALLRGVRRRPGRPGGRITPGLVLLAALAEFWLAAILAGALILAPPQAGAWTMALMSAVVIWIGFVLPTLLVTNGFDGLPTRSGLAHAAHWLVAMLAQAATLQAIGLVRPA